MVEKYNSYNLGHHDHKEWNMHLRDALLLQGSTFKS